MEGLVLIMIEDVKIIITAISGKTYTVTGYTISEFECRIRSVDVSLLALDESMNFVRLMPSAIESFKGVSNW